MQQIVRQRWLTRQQTGKLDFFMTHEIFFIFKISLSKVLSLASC